MNEEVESLNPQTLNQGYQFVIVNERIKILIVFKENQDSRRNELMQKSKETHKKVFLLDSKKASKKQEIELRNLESTRLKTLQLSSALIPC